MTDIAEVRVDFHGGRESVAHAPYPARLDAFADDDPLEISNVDAWAVRDPVQLTVIVPTRNEVDNVGVLLERLGAEFAAMSAEILIVDDSDDETPAAVVRYGADSRVPVRLLHRAAADRNGGLSGAVVAAARHARGDWVLVMDADLQHPPAAAATLAVTAMRHDIDVVVGTRYAGTGSKEGLNGAGRVATSSLAVRLAKTMFPRRLATVSDPMSGLFAFRRSAIELDRLNPIGFKLLLEILVRHPAARVAEVTYQMDPRFAGDSKASFRQGMTYLRHLGRLRKHRLAGQIKRGPVSRQDRVRQLVRMFAFGMVGLSGLGVNTLALVGFYDKLGWHHLVAAAVATQVSTLWNFALIELLVYRGRGNGSGIGRGVRFWAMNNLLLLLRLPFLQLLVLASVSVVVANASTLLLLFLLRFFVSDRVIYGSGNPESGRDPVHLLVDQSAAKITVPSARKRTSYLKYRYDVAGVVTIGSQVMLPELEFFRSQWVHDGEVDIAIRVGDVGRRRPKRRASMTEHTEDTRTVHYEEHLGRFGANFRVELGDQINITVGPLLARSPHVVYTNIVEALLRFVLVSRGRMLLHSACLTLGGVGVMLSALTDTGKTATILRLLRDNGGRFLSDDMTIVDDKGNAVCFPKPLTISAHTLRAVNANDLTKKEWRRLQFQSRLHSKGGRSLAMVLARFNVPIMGINAITQMLVPPPKYMVDRLISCKLGSSARVEELFIIERGAPHVSDLDRESTLARMIENTDDAYGFPPFRYLAPAVTVGGLGYAELREKERQILAGFLSNVRTRVVGSDNFGWADEIPKLVGRRDYGAESTEAFVPVGRLPGTTDVFPNWGGELAVTGGMA